LLPLDNIKGVETKAKVPTFWEAEAHKTGIDILRTPVLNPHFVKV
jgi:hypothetical protein